MKLRTLAASACLITSLCAGSSLAGAPPPALNSSEFAQGPYSSMHMLLEKTILKVDVLTVDVRFGKAVQGKLQQLASGKQYSDELGKQLADTVIAADDALVQLRFVRDVSLDQWMDGVFENLDQAQAAGLISGKLKQKVKDSLPNAFAAVKERGYKEGDRVLYRVKPDSLRTVVVAKDGAVLVDKTDQDKEALRVVLASYFAPKSDFREPLLKSFFK
jgi:hypothetical protein